MFQTQALNVKDVLIFNPDPLVLSSHIIINLHNSLGTPCKCFWVSGGPIKGFYLMCDPFTKDPNTKLLNSLTTTLKIKHEIKLRKFFKMHFKI